VKDYVTNDFVLANTKNATFLTYPEGTYDYQWALDTFDQFYLNAGTDAKSHLSQGTGMRRTRLAPGEPVLLPRTSASSSSFTSVMCRTNTTNLNIGDQNPVYPEQRRCLVFKTKQ